MLFYKVVLVAGKWCPGADLNHRHEDFQSTALPTELPGRCINAHLPNFIFAARTDFDNFNWFALKAKCIKTSDLIFVKDY